MKAIKSKSGECYQVSGGRYLVLVSLQAPRALKSYEVYDQWAKPPRVIARGFRTVEAARHYCECLGNLKVLEKFRSPKEKQMVRLDRPHLTPEQRRQMQEDFREDD